jgi:hypothetical protein
MMYGLLATRMLEEHVYSSSDTYPYTPEVNWAPGYPLAVVLSLSLFHSVIPLVFIQIVLAGVTAILMFRIGKEFLPEYFAVIPPLFFALDVSIAYYTSTAHTDGFFMSLFTILIYILFFHKNTKITSGAFFGLGLLLGYLALLRTIGQYLIIVLPILYLAYMFFSKTISRTTYLHMGIFISGALLIITPWMIRNHTILDTYTLGNIGPKMFLQYYVQDFLTVQKVSDTNTDYAVSEAADKVRSELQAELDSLVHEHGGVPETYYGTVALKHIFADPFSYAKFHIIGTMPYFLAGSYRHFFVSTLGIFQENVGLQHIEHENIAHKMTAVLYAGTFTEIWHTALSLSLVLIEIFWRVLLLFCAIYALFVPGINNKIRILILWILVCYFAFLTGPAALTRYRIVSEPLFLVLSGIGAYTLGTHLRPHLVSLTHKLRLKQ